MNAGQSSLHLCFVGLVLLVTQPAWANKSEEANVQLSQTTSLVKESQMQVSTQARDFFAQQPNNTNTIQITGVKANPTDKGVEVILQTTQGQKLQVTNRNSGNNFIADISGGQLQLPNGEAFTFRSEKPLAGIIEITVINIDANTVRVTVVGDSVLPTVELFDDNEGLIFGVAPHVTATF